VGQLDFARISIFTYQDHGDQVEPQQGKVVQVVLSDRFAAQMGVDQAKPAKPARASPKSPDVRKLEVGGVPENNVADEAVARQEDADLASKFRGKRAEIFGEFGRYDLLGRNTSAENALQRGPLRLLDA
jgi:hypothetical protein